MNDPITHTIRARVVDPDSASMHPVELVYGTHQPHAVFLGFPEVADERTGQTLVWTFARDLLSEGLRQHAGLGDVSVWPSGRVGMPSHPEVITVRLSSTEGIALVELPYPFVVAFLTAAHQLVPRGCEEMHLDLSDERLVEVFGGDRS